MTIMKKIVLISGVFILAAWISGCDSKREPGHVYMPDMAYSRAFETYAERDSTIFTTDPANPKHLIFYNNMPVKGTLKRGELPDYKVPNDSMGLLTLSSTVTNPLPPLTTDDSIEAGRLFNINCAICHGVGAENNGPLASSGKFGGIKSIMAAAPTFADGRIFHVMTYGQNMMGSYASQLTRTQRWRIVQYIRSLQAQKAAGESAPATTAKAAADSVKRKPAK